MKRIASFLKDPFGKKAKRAAIEEGLRAAMQNLSASFAEKADPEIKPVLGADIGDGFYPISDLKAGDKVRWKSGVLKDQKWPKLDEVVTVYSVSLPVARQETGKAVDRMDFSVLYDLGDHVDEFAHDSRRFVRVEG